MLREMIDIGKKEVNRPRGRLPLSSRNEEIILPVSDTKAISPLPCSVTMDI